MCGNPFEAVGDLAKKSLKLATGVTALQEGVRLGRRVGALPASKAEQRAEAEASAAASRNAADAEAANLAGMRIRAQRKAMRENSLLTGAGSGRTTLGV
jgi:hypothetical protein